jgi:hypothetical protein
MRDWFLRHKSVARIAWALLIVLWFGLGYVLWFLLPTWPGIIPAVLWIAATIGVTGWTL